MKTIRKSYSLGAAGLAEGTNANTFRTTNAVHYVIDGRAFLKAATDNLPFSAGHTALAAKQTAAFFVWLDAAGAVTTTQAAVRPSPAGAAYVPGAWEWPEAADKACIGAIVIRTDNVATFTANTTDFGATDVVDTFHNVADDYGVSITY